METGPIRTLQIFESMMQVIRAEAKTAPINSLELSAALLMLMNEIKAAMPDDWPLIYETVSLSNAS